MALCNTEQECSIGCAKITEPIELPFGTVSGVGPRNQVLDSTSQQIKVNDYVW